jgi:hypothetical protein
VKAVESAVLAHGVAVTGSDRLAELAVALAAAWSDEDGDTFARVDRAAGSTGESALAVLGFLDLAIMDLAYERRPGDVLGVIREAARQAQPGLFDEPIDRH